MEIAAPVGVTVMVADTRAVEGVKPHLPAFFGRDRWVSTIITPATATATAIVFIEDGKVVDVWANQPMSIKIDNSTQWVLGRHKGASPLRVKAIEGVFGLMDGAALPPILPP